MAKRFELVTNVRCSAILVQHSLANVGEDGVDELVRKRERDLLHLGATRPSVVHADVGVVQLWPTAVLQQSRNPSFDADARSGQDSESDAHAMPLRWLRLRGVQLSCWRQSHCSRRDPMFERKRFTHWSRGHCRMEVVHVSLQS